MTRYARYKKRFNTTTIADERQGLTAAERREVEASKRQSIAELANSRNRRSKSVCLKCRQRGHLVKECPRGAENICYNCGSQEHILSECSKPRGADLSFASCFICKQTGHLASKCSQNTKGIYPRGGGCRFCGSNQHLARDCRPTQQADAGGFVGISVDPRRENPDDDLVFESLTRIQSEKTGKHAMRAKKAPSSTVSAKKAKVVSF